MASTISDHPRAVGLGTVIVILFAAVLLFSGIHFSSSTVNNTSNNFFTTEGNFHTWTLTWNDTLSASTFIPTMITPAAITITVGSNVTFLNIRTGVPFHVYSLFYNGPVPAATSSISGVYNLYSNTTSPSHGIVVLGQDGSLLQANNWPSNISVDAFIIAPNGQYVGVTTHCASGCGGATNARLVLYTGS